MFEKLLLSGDEAVAQASLDCGVKMGVGYPGTPSTEILEHFSALGGHAQWAPNEKVALEVGIGSAFANARTLVTMKHVGLNVAADPLFTVAYTGTEGGLVILTADDPGMASSQNEQDNRNYAVAAGLPMFEPSDSQETYDLLIKAFEISEKWKIPVIFRMTTRVCHSKCIVEHHTKPGAKTQPFFKRDVKTKVMVPAFARSAHRALRGKLAELAQFNESSDGLVTEFKRDHYVGIISSGISVQHSLEADHEASVLQLKMTYPLPLERIAKFAAEVERCIVIEEGDPWLENQLRAAGIKIEGKPEMYRFGELNVTRVRRILTGDVSPETVAPAGKPPQLCIGCPHRKAFETLRDLDCIVSGDIGCYTLGVMAPFNAMDTCVCMGASIGVALGMRQVLPEEQARRVVSVIGDSTFMHSGLTGIADMVYNRPPTGHVVLILDNHTTAMTGLQEHAATGRSLDHTPAPQIAIENVIKAMGVDNVDICDPTKDSNAFEALLKQRLASNDVSVIIARRPCILALAKIKQYEKNNQGCQ
ncbi:MAG: thiamine pyrophosphate-dependent enzyme [Victivallaceae bacterium]|nr:thiamine pyrophosphate-dependent enzyme [Victivallaceae bacterium]